MIIIAYVELVEMQFIDGTGEALAARVRPRLPDYNCYNSATGMREQQTSCHRATLAHFLTQKAAFRVASVSIIMSCIRLIQLAPVNVAICHVIGTTLLVFPVFLMRPVEGVKDRTYNATAPERRE